MDWGQGVSERSERNGHLGQKLCADLCQHSGCAARRAVVRKVWTGSEGEESEGKTNDWKWSIGGEGSGSLLRYVAGGGEGWEPCRDTRNDLTDHWEKTRALQMNGQGKS